MLGSWDPTLLVLRSHSTTRRITITNRLFVDSRHGTGLRMHDDGTLYRTRQSRQYSNDMMSTMRLVCIG